MYPRWSLQWSYRVKWEQLARRIQFTVTAREIFLTSSRVFTTMCSISTLFQNHPRAIFTTRLSFTIDRSDIFDLLVWRLRTHCCISEGIGSRNWDLDTTLQTLGRENCIRPSCRVNGSLGKHARGFESSSNQVECLN